MKYGHLLITFLAIIHFFSCSKKANPAVEAGVSLSLAEHRARTLKHIEYAIELNLPLGKAEPINASETISFEWKKNKYPLQIDFKEQTSNLLKLRVNGKDIPIIHKSEHLLVDPRFLKSGKNEVYVQFVAGDLSLNRNDDYLYTLLVPDRARTVFPCFDQPDLKAAFRLTLIIPSGWKALSSAPLLDSLISSTNKTYRYGTTDTISTYLFSFAAGKFELVKRMMNGREMNFYHRETDTAKIRHSLEPIFQIHADALAFMEAYTNIPYPFGKFDFIAIPDFQYGGMEHVGAIQYKAASLFLDQGATRDQELDRANLISHETSHMWFGDLVTMRWFNDVWMKEVFANFMADKITQVAMPHSSYDLEFLLDHFPAAYSVDRSAGAHPVRQQLSNLKDAGSLYGNIIYHKAPIVMRQLERLMGMEAFRDGLREYLSRYAPGNASWPELIDVLDRYTELDLRSWNKVWVNEPGRPQFDYRLTKAHERISEFVISQRGEDGSARSWPQLFEIRFVYPDHEEEFTVHMNAKETILKEVAGKPLPSYILFNSTGQGYGVFPVDTPMLAQLGKQDNPVNRAAAYINLYENMLNGKYTTPLELLNFNRGFLPVEPEELNLKLLCGQLGEIFWHYITPATRVQLSPELEKDIWSAMHTQKDSNKKKLLFKAYQVVALTMNAQDSLYNVWKHQQAPGGVRLSEDDYTSLALSLAVRDYPAKDILQEQLKRIQNPDRQKRLEFLMPALSPDVKVRDAFFHSLRSQSNREKESWVTAALQYLHHPLRADESRKYLPESLDLLDEIQRTGDIFFPQSWLQATFGLYQTPEAAAVVRKFLDDHPGYNLKLRGKILQAADGLFRAEKLTGNSQ